ESLNWGDIDNPTPVAFVRRDIEHDPIDAPKKGRTRFSGSRRRQDESRFPPRDGWPTHNLRCGGGWKYRFKPFPHGGMEDPEALFGCCCGFELVSFRQI